MPNIAEVTIASEPQWTREMPAENCAVVRHLTHELRQPLSTIEAAAYYLQMVTEDVDPRVARQIERIQEMVDQMSWILCDAVHYVQAGSPAPAFVNLADLLYGTIEEQALEEIVEIQGCEGGPAPIVFMDPAQARHLIKDVLFVFRLMARPHHPVAVKFERTGTALRWTCSTTGPDSLCANFGALFEPFTPYLPAGAGLALASVRRIAEMSGGSARFTAEGTTISLELSLPGF